MTIFLWFLRFFDYFIAFFVLINMWKNQLLQSWISAVNFWKINFQTHKKHRWIAARKSPEKPGTIFSAIIRSVHCESVTLSQSMYGKETEDEIASIIYF